MSTKIISLPQAANSLATNYEAELDQAYKSIKNSEIIIAPAENGYLYLVDAFDTGAVSNLHKLLDKPDTDLFQVFLPRVSTVTGVCSLNLQPTDSLFKLFSRCWPGAVSITMKTQPGLSWNLGTQSNLVNVRVPDQKFLLKLLEQTGPLAVASTKMNSAEINAAIKNNHLAKSGSDGNSGISGSSQIMASLFFDAQNINSFPSTIIEILTENSIKFVREGAITYEQIKAWSSELAITIVP
jgi:tRNA threonylcarbamoyl adenosine modification protein (Sua5/YciO/YrdC/YwlC family)